MVGMEIDKWIGTDGETYSVYQKGTFARILKNGLPRVSIKDAEEIYLRFSTYATAHKTIQTMEGAVEKLRSFSRSVSEFSLGSLTEELESIKLYEAYSTTRPSYKLGVHVTDDFDNCDYSYRGVMAMLSVVTETGTTAIKCNTCGCLYNQFLLDGKAKILFEYLIATNQIYDQLKQTLPLDQEFLSNTTQFLNDYAYLNRV